MDNKFKPNAICSQCNGTYADHFTESGDWRFRHIFMESEPPTVDDKRISFCIKLWLKELKEIKKDDDNFDAAQWIIGTIENEIVNGQYCGDDEYEAYCSTGVI